VVNDFAFAVVGPGGLSGTAELDVVVHENPISFTALSGGTDTWLFGYPAAQKYQRTDLIHCRGPLGSDPRMADATYGVGCNMTGGSSGGPWLSPFTSATGEGTLVSVNSYGDQGESVMYGPKFNEVTAALFADAQAAAR
jgi:hypothetical protein